MKNLAIHFLFFLIIFQANSQTIKKGRLIDYYLDVPIGGAKISVYNKDVEVISDSLGNFEIELNDTDFFLISARGYVKLKGKAPESSSFTIHVESTNPPLEAMRFYSVVDESAHLVGGQGFIEHILKSFKYWDRINRENIYGRVKVELKIDENGKIMEVKIAKGLAKFIDDELLRIINETQWVPAKLDGRNVKARITSLIPF